MANDPALISIRFRPASKALGPSHWEVLDTEYLANLTHPNGQRNEDGAPAGLVITVPVGGTEAHLYDTYEGTGIDVPLASLAEYVPALAAHRHGARVLAASY